MVDFSDHAARLSAEADTRLGDLILYSTGNGPFVAIRGRIFATETPAGTGFGSMTRRDEMLGIWRMRVAKDLVPNPSKDSRFKCAAILGDDVQYRPIARDPVSDGRYWLIDLQKV